jgi:hypothetical protein
MEHKVRWMQLLGPIKREFLSLEDAEIEALYVGFMVNYARHMLSSHNASRVEHAASAE